MEKQEEKKIRVQTPRKWKRSDLKIETNLPAFCPNCGYFEEEMTLENIQINDNNTRMTDVFNRPLADRTDVVYLDFQEL